MYVMPAYCFYIMPTCYSVLYVLNLQLEQDRLEAKLAKEREAEREMLERRQREYEEHKEKRAAEDRLREEEEEEDRRKRDEERRRREEERKKREVGAGGKEGEQGSGIGDTKEAAVGETAQDQ